MTMLQRSLSWFVISATAIAAGPGPFVPRHAAGDDDAAAAAKADEWLKAMTLDEKIGQMTQADLKAVSDKADVAKYAPRLDPQRRRFRPRRHLRPGLGEDPRRAPVLGAQEPAQDPDHLRDRRRPRAQQCRRGRRLPAQHRPGSDARPGPRREGLRGSRPSSWPARASAGPSPRAWRWPATSGGAAPTRASARTRARRDRWAPRPSAGSKAPASPTATSALACAKHYLGDGGTTGRRRPGEHRVRRGHAPEDPPAGLRRRHQGRRRVGHGLVQPLERHARCTANQSSADRPAQEELGFTGFVVSDWAAIDQLSERLQGGHRDRRSTPASTWS